MIYGIPHWVFWSVGCVALVVGLASILFPDRIVRCLRVWLMRQMRWIRSPRYRRMLRIQGWLLFVLSTLMLVLMVLVKA